MDPASMAQAVVQKLIEITKGVGSQAASAAGAALWSYVERLLSRKKGEAEALEALKADPNRYANPRAVEDLLREHCRASEQVMEDLKGLLATTEASEVQSSVIQQSSGVMTTQGAQQAVGDGNQQAVAGAGGSVNQRDQRFTVKSCVVVTLSIGVVTVGLAVLVPSVVTSFLGQAQRGSQKRTMSDFRSIGTAMESYVVDHGFYPVVDGEVQDLSGALSPRYVRELPTTDRWNRPIYAFSNGRSYTILSFGEDGPPAGFPEGQVAYADASLVFSNGQFITYPEGLSPNDDSSGASAMDEYR